MITPKFDNSFARLGADFGTRVSPAPLQGAQLIHCNQSLLATLQMDAELARQLVEGQDLPDDIEPFAMVYAGHQFGGFSPQLGDGRGLLLGEWRVGDHRYDLHLKGAGKTPYSRFGDGRAVLRSSIREYLASAALNALGVPSSSALAIAASDEPVQREQLETGAGLLRVSQCHIRFGHFEYFFYQRMEPQLAQLIDYCARRYLALDADTAQQAQALLEMATQNTARMIAHWQAIGFAHGVMNTDNMSLIGETFDFGPFAFLDRFDPGHICNHSDDQGRYRFDRQPNIGLWNLNALAHTFSALLPMDTLRRILAGYEQELSQHYHQLMMAKLGLTSDPSEQKHALLTDLLSLLEQDQVDYTTFFARLSQDPQSARDLCIDRPRADQWMADYQRLCDANADDTTIAAMRQINPLLVLRNHHAQTVIEAAEAGDYSLLADLMQALQQPYAPARLKEPWVQPPPAHLRAKPISCSS
ncbi:protein adenylyltransferase SelO [Simiduia agarivorans]|uniref:Protein nucleotidyltransferase YdiU n=1 Tax=Simiduia agarivorans (strain DSM 21679 / JCM 13881 / BCRC 17597 / SA1) TaxID=1117647 RepID=K4KI92_SIMAS|nr:YdiU family protein [Simiduia agarivorans]AFU98869.1 hypothetical protein M5M_08400 [Simiduia agarivorans SA1 = DSM 21679]